VALASSALILHLVWHPTLGHRFKAVIRGRVGFTQNNLIA